MCIRDSLSKEALEKKHRLETDPSSRKNHMEYMEDVYKRQDYEVVKGGMDDVFLAVTGKRLEVNADENSIGINEQE